MPPHVLDPELAERAFSTPEIYLHAAIPQAVKPPADRALNEVGHSSAVRFEIEQS
jgi:hypothetical protein